jgi:hypothetical protein
MTDFEISLRVVRSDKEILEELLKSLAKSEAMQIFITGPEAFRILADQVGAITSAEGQAWTVLPCPYAPTQTDMRSLMEQFAADIHNDPVQRRICFGPTSPERLLEFLFKPSPNGFYNAGLYILGSCDPPISNLVQFSKAVNCEGKAPGFIETILSAEDRGLLIREQQELRTRFDQGGDIGGKMWEILTTRQEKVEAEEKALREPHPPEQAGLLSNLFGRKAKAETQTALADAERRKRGLLPPPQNIAFNYKCECGRYLSVDLGNFDVIRGVQVSCAHCGAVCFVPPEILDHTKYDPARKGATLRGDFQSLLRFVRHGARS